MKIRLTKYGMPQVVVFPSVIVLLMVAGVFPGWAFLSIKVIISIELVLLALLAFVMAFFRDPHRTVPVDTNLILAPADGRITDIDTTNHPDINGQALRIGIFLSVFNVHINRMPCAAKVERTTYRKGCFKNAMAPDSARVNESNDILITRLNDPKDKLLIRQISGAIARRIVCAAGDGQEFTGGQRFGMIKFGSRTELYLPQKNGLKCCVKVGNKVKAGITVLAEYEDRNNG
jgi:phosphatidylserine decarboxylase